MQRSESASRFPNPPYNPSSSTPISPAATTTTSSVGYSAYGYGSGSAVAGPSGTSGNTASGSGTASAARARLQGMMDDGGRHMRQVSGDSGRPGSKDSRETSRMHFMALRSFLRTWLQNESPTSRASAREKLTRLTRSQFNELSTDVYDELVRRQNAEETAAEASPFLPVRQDFHPKRNQARQKLATLPKNRFKDLASDVYFELKRRYPEFEEVAMQADSAQYYDKQPPAPLPTSERLVPGPERRPSQISRIPNSQSHQASLSISASANSSMNEVIVPNKSTISEEMIEVPYARVEEEEQEEIFMRPQSSTSELESRRSSGRGHVRSESRNGNGDLSRERGAPQENFSRSSISSNSRPPLTNQSIPTSNSTSDLAREQRARGDLEGKLTGMERRLQGLEKELEDSSRRERWERERSRELEEEVRGLKERANGHASSLRSVQRELEAAQSKLQSDQQQAEMKRREDQEEVVKWSQKCVMLENELHGFREAHLQRNDLESEETMQELQNEVISLVDELKMLSIRNDDMMAEKDVDMTTIQQLDDEAREYRRKWEATKTELRNLKATSTMFISKPVSDDHLPASPDGNIADVHVTDFQSAIDALLTAARSSTPTGVLPAMKGVVEAITNISDDVKVYESSPNFTVNSTQLEDFKHRSSTTLNALMQAARNHAMSSGLSPVSLLDAAAGHVSANVVEIIKLLKIRRTIKKENSRGSLFAAMNGNQQRSSMEKSREGTARRQSGGTEVPARQKEERPSTQRRDSSQYRSDEYISPTDKGASNGMMPSLSNMSTPSSERPRPDRSYSIRSATSLQSDAFDLDTTRKNTGSIVSGMDTMRSGTGGYPFQTQPQQAQSQPMTPRGSSRGIVVDTGGNGVTQRPSNGMTRTDTASSSGSLGGPPALPPRPIASASEDLSFEDENDDQRGDWEELKPYLQTQSSALVNAIQKLLAEIRNASQTSELNDHLSEVIAIGSSIVAVSADSLPTSPSSLKLQGDALLSDLVRDTNRLGEHQGRKTFEKSVRQDIASAAFGVAKSLKALMKLGSD